MAKKLHVNSEACVGCGLCVGSHPEAFEFDDENKAVCVAELDEDSCEEVISSCPAVAISEEE